MAMGIKRRESLKAEPGVLLNLPQSLLSIFFQTVSKEKELIKAGPLQHWRICYKEEI